MFGQSAAVVIPAGMKTLSESSWPRERPETFSSILPSTWKFTLLYEDSVPGVKWNDFVLSRAFGASVARENLPSGLIKYKPTVSVYLAREMR